MRWRPQHPGGDHRGGFDTASLRQAKRQTVAVDMEEGLLTVLADSQRVRQVLFNLLSSVQVPPDEGHIAISASDQGAVVGAVGPRQDRPGMTTRDAVWVAVSDDGVGVRSAGHVEVVRGIQPVDSLASRRAQGTGLGLALCRKFVELHGGTIGCESIRQAEARSGSYSRWMDRSAGRRGDSERWGRSVQESRSPGSAVSRFVGSSVRRFVGSSVRRFVGLSVGRLWRRITLDAATQSSI
jgi:signal transduction histidine kinase